MVAIQREDSRQPAILERQSFERHVGALDDIEAVDASVLHADGLDFSIRPRSEANDLRQILERIERLVIQAFRHGDAGYARDLLAAACPLRLFERQAPNLGKPSAVLEHA